MSNPEWQSNTGTESTADLRGAAGNAAAAASRFAGEAASSAAAQFKGMIEDRIGSAAETATRLTASTRRAADDLDDEAPQIAQLIRTAADRADGYIDDLQNQSFDDIVRSASQFARRQPALVFGLAALAGFFTYRLAKSAADAASAGSPSIQPGSQTRPSRTAFAQESRYDL